jgi:hypothetical protein
MDEKKYSGTHMAVTALLAFLAGGATGATVVIATMPPEGYGFMQDEAKAPSTK